MPASHTSDCPLPSPRGTRPLPSSVSPVHPDPPDPPARGRSIRRGDAFAALLALAAASLPASPLAAQPRLPPVHHYVTHEERFLSRIPIGSDGLLVGLEAEEEADGELPADEWIVHLPASAADSLCVSIRSIDGRYEGTFQFAARRMQRGPVRVDLRSRRYHDQRARFPPRHLAVRAWLANSCSAGPGTLVVAGRTVAPPAGIRLSLNADAGLQVYGGITPASPGAAPVPCPLVPEPNPYVFNRACVVPLPGTARAYAVRVTRRLRGTNARHVTYTLEVP